MNQAFTSLGAIATSSVLAITLHASASVDVVSYTSHALWRAAPTNTTLNLFQAGSTPVFATETLDMASGSASSFSGGAGWTAWTATSSSGSVSSTGTGLYAGTAGTSLQFNFTSEVAMPMGGVRGVGGGFNFVDANGEFTPGKIWLVLSTGDTLVKTINSPTQFVGFWVTNPDMRIESIRLRPLGTNAMANRVGADNLYLGMMTVPAPGAIALLGAVGLIATNRRRS